MNKYRIENPNNKDVREYKSRTTESLRNHTDFRTFYLLNFCIYFFFKLDSKWNHNSALLLFTKGITKFHLQLYYYACI